MSVTLRCWFAGPLLAASALVLCAGSDPRSLASRAVIFMVALFAHVWVIAVAERTCPDRGGLASKRFLLGSRLLEGRSDLLVQFLVPVALLGLASHSFKLAAVGTLIVVVLSIQVFRKALPILLPIGGLIYALVSMDEFHTLGDLLLTAQGWVMGAMAFACWSLVLSGPLLRTDVAGRLLPKARLVALLAGLPCYALAVVLFTWTPLAGTQTDMLALAVALLAGGVVQSLVLSMLSRSAEIEDRAQLDFPWVEPRDVGIALMPLTMPLLAVVAFGWVRLPTAWAALAIPSAWAGLLALALIIPAIPAAGLVGAALDRLDGRSRGRGAVVFAGALFALWFAFGPLIVQWIYAEGGPMDGLRSTFPTSGTWIARSADDGQAALGGTVLGGGLTLYGIAVADLVRGATLMMLGVSALCARYLRHAALGLIGVGFGTMTIAWVLQILLCFLLMSKLGPMGAALGTTATCLVMLAVDVRTGERVAPQAGEQELDSQVELLPDPESL
jgi:hypothetical protein